MSTFRSVKNLFIEGVALYFEILAEEIERRQILALPRIRRIFAFIAVTLLVSIIYPVAIGGSFIQEAASRVFRPWRVEIFRDGHWRDLDGFKSIEDAIHHLSLEAKSSNSSWRIRRGNEIFPGEILTP